MQTLAVLRVPMPLKTKVGAQLGTGHLLPQLGWARVRKLESCLALFATGGTALSKHRRQRQRFSSSVVIIGAIKAVDPKKTIDCFLFFLKKKGGGMVRD